jgi:hypothetical protein
MASLREGAADLLDEALDYQLVTCQRDERGTSVDC